MKQSDQDTLNLFFGDWDGANATFVSYFHDHDRFVLAFGTPGDIKNSIGVTFFNCFYIAGPTRWKSSKVRVRIVDIGDGELGFEAYDENAGFLLKCGGPVSVGNNQLVVPST